MLARLEQPWNAHSPIEVTLSGIVMLARLEQRLNAHSPIDVTLSGIVMLVRLVQPWNAPLNREYFVVPVIEVTGKPLCVLGMSKDPLAV